jgi:hypothetical protein
MFYIFTRLQSICSPAYYARIEKNKQMSNKFGPLDIVALTFSMLIQDILLSSSGPSGLVYLVFVRERNESCHLSTVHGLSVISIMWYVLGKFSMRDIFKYKLTWKELWLYKTSKNHISLVYQLLIHRISLYL